MRYDLTRKEVNELTGFWALLEKSVIVSGFIAVTVVGAIVYLSVTGQPIPELLGNAALIIIGFFFGAKTTDAGYRAMKGS